MNNIEKLKYEYDILKQELSLVKENHQKLTKRKKVLETQIKKLSNYIFNLENKDIIKINPTQKIIKRDVDIVVEFLGTNGMSSPNQIIEHLNSKLKGKKTRWRGELENSSWSGMMEPYLMRQGFVDKIKKGRNIFFFLSKTKLKPL